VPWRRPRIFYGWWIVAAGFTIECLIGALVFHAYGAYVVLLQQEFGWSKTLLSAAFALARAESSILGPVQGWLTDRFGPRALIRVGMGIFAGGYLLFSQVRSPVTFFVAFFLIALGSSLGGYLPTSVAIVNWFRRRRALALALSSLGMPVGGLLAPLVVSALTRFGWRWTAAASALVVLAVGLPASRLVRHRPRAPEEWPDGESPVAAGPAAGRPAPAPAGVDFTAREAMRSRAFWLIAAGHGAALLVVSAVVVHLMVHVTERLGYSLQQGAGVVALMTVVQIGAMFAGGWAGDRVSKRTLAAGAMVGHGAALLLLAHATSFWMVVAFAVLHGAAWGVRGPLMAAIRADYFGSAAFGTITGFSSMVVMIGMMAGPIAAGALADRTGSYRAGFTLLAVLALSGSVAFLLARRPAPPRLRAAPPAAAG
jgi:MFS family permease